MSHSSLNRTHQLKHHIIITLNNILGFGAIISYPAPAEKRYTVRMKWKCFTLGQFFMCDGYTSKAYSTFPAMTKMEKAILLRAFVCLFVSSSLFHLCLSRLPPFTPSSIPGERGSVSGTSKSPACPFEGKRKPQKNWNGQLLKCEGRKKMKRVKPPVRTHRTGRNEKQAWNEKRGWQGEKKRGKGHRKKSKVVLSKVCRR